MFWMQFQDHHHLVMTNQLDDPMQANDNKVIRTANKTIIIFVDQNLHTDKEVCVCKREFIETKFPEMAVSFPLLYFKTFLSFPLGKKVRETQKDMNR